jgi:ATP-dependent helicase HrpB
VRPGLPVDAALPAIVDALLTSRAVVVTAAPGAGKTTRVAPALVDQGPLILLQPRRSAARAIAHRIASEQQWTVGREVGWEVRFDRRFSADTRLLVATEGILTVRLQRDPLASAFQTIVLDEFHERSLHADLSLALARQAWLARPDLRLVVMSATLDPRPVSRFLGDCPVIEVPGRLHPIDVHFAPGQSVEDTAVAALQATPGDVLAFLPGAAEINRTVAALSARVGPGISVLPLHGGLDDEAQDRALRGRTDGRRRIVVATNLAETSVTVPDVTAVVDSGLQKIARYDADRGIDSLVTERVTQDAAAQRTGRAGRLAPGVAWRLWDARDRLRPHREAEIHRVDLSSAALDIVAWGGDPRAFEWFEAPARDALEAALMLLERLGAVRSRSLTDVGREMARLPLHPRLARMLVAAQGARSMIRSCALLSAGARLTPRSASTSSDVLSLIDDWASTPDSIQAVARQVEGQVRGRFTSAGQPASDDDFRRAVLAGYPDRVAQRRGPRDPRCKLSSGAGAVLSPSSGVREGDYIVALEVRAPRKAGDADSVINLASRIEREWLEPTETSTRTWIDGAGRLRAARVVRYDALTLAEQDTAVENAEHGHRLLADAWMARPRTEAEEQLLRRLRFAGSSLDLRQLVEGATRGATSVDGIDLAGALPVDLRRRVDLDAPRDLLVPSGRRLPLEYQEDGTVSARVKLQELVGLGETPRIGPRREPVLLLLLAPNGNPVQMTRDLKSFWQRTYPEVRKELRGRYPRHPWPEDPWTATPTARPTPRRRP